MAKNQKTAKNENTEASRKSLQGRIAHLKSTLSKADLATVDSMVSNHKAEVITLAYLRLPRTNGNTPGMNKTQQYTYDQLTKVNKKAAEQFKADCLSGKNAVRKG